MTTIAETNNSESVNLWNDYSTAEKAIRDQVRLGDGCATFAFGSSCILNSLTPLLYVQATKICLVVFPILTLFGAICLRKKFYRAPYLASVSLGWSLAATLFSIAHPLVRFGPTIFGMMCLYSSYLQTVGLTKERFLELSLGKLKEIIASEEPKKECVLIDAILKQGEYNYIYVNSEKLSQSDMENLLSLAYQHKKILSFSSLIEIHHYYYRFEWDGVTVSTICSLPTKPSEFWDQVALNVQSYGHDKAILKAFKRSVDYLIQCKKQNLHLDDHFINAQLAYLGPKFYLNYNALRLKPNLSLKNGNPVITTRIGELGSIKEIIKQLLEYFDSIELVTENVTAGDTFAGIIP